MEKFTNKRSVPPNLAQIRIQELVNEDRGHGRRWMGLIICFAIVCSAAVYVITREKDFALAILNVACVGVGYFVGQHPKG